MIRTFRDRDTARVFARERVPRFSVEVQRIAQRKLAMIDAAESIEDLRAPPGNRLEQRAGDRAGQHSIRVNDRWRICFVWRASDAYDVEIVDDHSSRSTSANSPESHATRRNSSGRVLEALQTLAIPARQGHFGPASAYQRDCPGQAGCDCRHCDPAGAVFRDLRSVLAEPSDAIRRGNRKGSPRRNARPAGARQAALRSADR